MTEVALGIAAISRSSSEAVRNFALTMVREHREAQQRLEVLAQSKDLEMPSELDAQHKAFVKGMRVRWGAMFDSAYAAHMVSNNQNAITLFKGESTAQDQDLAAYAVHTLATLESNEEMAERLVFGGETNRRPDLFHGSQSNPLKARPGLPLSGHSV